LNLRQGG